MPRRYPPEVRRQVIDLARSGTRVPQLAATFGISEATIYNWLKQEKVDRGEIDGTSTDQALELAVAKRRIRQLETRARALAQGQRSVPQRRLGPKRLYPVIESLTGQGINVRHACHVLGVSESGYYAWKGRPPSPRTLRRIWLASEIVDVHKASNGTYGARRVMAELRHGRQIAVGHNAVELIMRELGIKGLPTRRRPKGSRLGNVTSLDLVRRAFRREAPNQLWMTISPSTPPGRARSTAASSWTRSHA
jgi:putative transposase